MGGKKMTVLENIKAKAKELLEAKEVEVVIGFAQGTLPGKCTPYFARTTEEVERFVWQDGCNLNLANYLSKFSGKVGIIAKGCDTRSIINLIKENQVNRERIYIIGANCPSMGSCHNCRHPQGVIADFYAEQVQLNNQDDFSDVEAFEELLSEERKNYFYQEMSKCIRCYACRNVCPACYCKECFVEENLPCWLGKTTDLADNIIFHLTRTMHVAGRCIDCGACVRACPMEVNLSLLNRKLLKDIQELFNTEPGLSLEAEPVLNEYKEDDPQPFLIGGEESV